MLLPRGLEPVIHVSPALAVVTSRSLHSTDRVGQGLFSDVLTRVPKDAC